MVSDGDLTIEQASTLPVSYTHLAGYLFWKVVAYRSYEILPGCWDIKLTGERLVPRESEQMLLERCV